jgi:DNA-binding ferritin-like protein (Dps family)
MAENYRLIDTTLNMFVIRLGDILLPMNELNFVQEVAKLDNYEDWMRVEREFRLCQSLRAALREMQSFSGHLKAAVSVKDIDALLSMMEETTATEGEVAGFISSRFRELASAARIPGLDAAGIEMLRKDVKEFRDALLNERQQLIRDEIELYSIV